MLATKKFTIPVRGGAETIDAAPVGDMIVHRPLNSGEKVFALSTAAGLLIAVMPRQRDCIALGQRLQEEFPETNWNGGPYNIGDDRLREIWAFVRKAEKQSFAA